MPQWSTLDSLPFFVYINDLPNSLITDVKLFVDNSSISLVVNNNVSTEEINNDLKKISKWAYQWKVMFNPGITKLAQEVIFFSENREAF